MNISVAVLASLSNTGKYGLDVTLSTLHGLMHTAQRVAGLIVIELGNRADRLPTFRAVTVLTGDPQASMRTMRFPIGGNRWFISSREPNLQK